MEEGEGGEKVSTTLGKAISDFSPQRPEIITDALLGSLKMLRQLDMPKPMQEYWSNEITSTIFLCSGLFIETNCLTHSYSTKDKITLKTSIVNRGNLPVKIKSLRVFLR